MSDPVSELRITVEELDGVTIRVVGEIDYETSGSLRDAVVGALATARGESVVFDLGEVGFMDSSGLAVLIEAENRGATVRVREASPAVALTIRATGLQHLLGPER
jgi:anti-sigma B factor antagonist